ncbi:MAG TPA: hypothetical protein VF792_03935 [Ktedonobacterales bacterium]
MIRVTSSVPWLTGQVSVSCPAGSTLVGGGVDNGYGTTTYAGVESSFPSDANTWKVIGPASNVSQTLTVVADCLQSATPLTTQIVQLTTPTSTYTIPNAGVAVSVYDVRCSSGVVVGGGYDAGGYIVESYPDGSNGWSSSSARGGMTAYAICASASIHVTTAQKSAIYPKYSGSGPDVPVETWISCPSGYTPLSGGFSQPQASSIQVGWGSNELTSSGQQWYVTGANKSGVADEVGYVYALCGLLA